MQRSTPSIKPGGSDRVEVGVLGKPFGLKGDIYVRLFDPDSQTLFQTTSLLVSLKEEQSVLSVKLASARRHRGHVIVSFIGFPKRSDVEQLRGATLLVERDQLPEVESGEFYDVDLVGLTLESQEGERLGVVIDVEHPPAADVLVVQLDGGLFADLPMVEGVVLTIEVGSSRIVVDLPDGLPTRTRR